MQKPEALSLELDCINLGSNYRRHFNEFALAALARSIRDEGLIKPVIVNRMYQDGCARYELVAGQRRYMAHRLIGAGSIDCMVYDSLSQEQVLSIQIAENLQERIAPEERAVSYWRMYTGALCLRSGIPLAVIESYGSYWSIPQELSRKYSMTQFCRDVGKSHGRMIQYFRWQVMCGELRELVQDASLPYTVAAEFARIGDHAAQRDGLARGLHKGSSVRVRKSVDQYVLDREMEKDCDFQLSPAPCTVPRRDFEDRASDAFEGFAAFFRAYVQICDELGIDGLSAVDSLGERTACICSRLDTIDGGLQSSALYGSAMAAGRKRSLRELILDGAGKQHQEGVRSREFRVQYLPVGSLRPDPSQPRRRFFQQTIDELAASISALGILEPVLVVPDKDAYRIVTGHRRTIAARKAGIALVPAKVDPSLSEAEIRIIQHEEDICEAISKGDRAEAIFQLMRLKESQLSCSVGSQLSLGLEPMVRKLSARAFSCMMPVFTEAEVENALRYHCLDDRIKSLEERGLLSYSIAIKLGVIEDRDKRYEWAMRAVLGGWTSKEADARLRQDAVAKERYCSPLVSGLDDFSAGIRFLLKRLAVENVEGFASMLNAVHGLDSMSWKKDPGRRFVEAYVDAKNAFFELVASRKAGVVKTEASHVPEALPADELRTLPSDA